MQSAQALSLPLTPLAPRKMDCGGLGLGLPEGSVEVGADAMPGQIVG